ncbi:MAG TPA: hypothetical protein VGJ92_00605 [Methanocella sp.]
MRLPAFIERNKKRLLTGTVAAVVAIFVVVCIAGIGIFLCLMSTDNHVRPPGYEYIATVRGLDNFSTADGTARIMLPVPMYNGRAAVPFDKTLYEGYSGIPLFWGWFGPYGAVAVNIQGYGVHGTKSFCVTDTGYGRMIEARIVETDYFEVNRDSPYYPSRENDTPNRYEMYTVRRSAPAFDDYTMRLETAISPAFSNETNATLQGLAARPLYPDAGDLPAPYTRAMADNLTGYTSYVYIDEGLKPAGAGNHTIDIDASFVISAAYRPYYMEPGDHHLFLIHESVPAGVTGFVPVRVQYDGRYNDSALAARLHYFRVDMLPEIDRPT